MQNLLASWQEFLRGKRKRKDVAEFSVHLMDEISSLHKELADKKYKHGTYQAFKVNDPKPRDIHKASVRDRLLHHAIHRVLSPYFNAKFIYHSYSSRVGKGTHRAIHNFRNFARKVSLNNTRTCWILKCDIKKFFDNIDHEILIEVLSRYLSDPGIIELLKTIIYSFSKGPGRGLPLGNLTSQLFVNIYMNEFDQFIKRELKARYYIRFADDFVILHEKRQYLETILPKISLFLESKLRLSLHPNKISIKTSVSGVDFLGWVNFPTHRVLRTSTKRRMFRNIKDKRGDESTIRSYLGMISHGNARGLEREIEELLLK